MKLPLTLSIISITIALLSAAVSGFSVVYLANHASRMTQNHQTLGYYPRVVSTALGSTVPIPKDIPFPEKVPAPEPVAPSPGAPSPVPIPDVAPPSNIPTPSPAIPTPDSPVLN